MTSEEKIEMQLMKFLDGNLSEDEVEKLRSDMEAYNMGTPEEWVIFYGKMNELPTASPTVKMDERFFDSLSKQEKTQAKMQWISTLELQWQQLWQPKFTTYGFLLLLGLIFGYAIGFAINPHSDKVEILLGEVAEMRQEMMLTLLEKESPFDRLKAVTISQQIPEANERIVRALLKTLNEDDDQNVRLAAIEALLQYAENPLVRQGLITSIEKQDSPLVQVTLAEVMVSLSEKRSVSELRALLDKSELDSTVRQKVQRSIEILL